MTHGDGTFVRPTAPSEAARQPMELWSTGTNTVLLTASALLVMLIASHWPTLTHMAERWSSDPQYSHGFLVPVFAFVVLWSRRNKVKRLQWTPAWLGLPIMLAGVGTRLLARQMDFEPLEALSLLPTAFGAVLLVGGHSVLGWMWPALAFLVFMVPLPYSAEVALALPLRHLATVVSTFALQTLGCPAMAEGNTIVIEDMRLGVAEACSGLGMLMTFFALSSALAMTVKAPTVDRVGLVASAVPIAILANVVRISATGLAYFYVGKDSELAKAIYHDFAGWLMMPMALGMLWFELKLASFLLVEQRDAAPLPLFHADSRALSSETRRQGA